VGLPPSWLHWLLLVLVTARTFVLLSDLATPDASRIRTGRLPFVLPLVHALTIGVALAFGQTTLGGAVALVALAQWLMLTTPPQAWRTAGGALAILYGSSLAVGVAVASAMPVARQMWTNTNETPSPQSLTVWTLRGAHWLLSTIDPTASYQPERARLGVRDFHVTVGAPCAGVEGMGLVVVFLAAYLVLFRRTLLFPRALLLLPVGLALTFCLNLVRITAMVLIGAHGWPDVAVAGFHSRAGWLAFNGIAVGLAAVGRSTLLGTGATVEARHERSAVAPYLMPVLAFLAASLVSEAASAGFERFYGLRVLCVGGVVWWYRDDYRLLPWRVGWESLALGMAVFGFWMLLPRSGSDRAVSEGLSHLSSAAAALWMVLRVMGSVLVAPFAEELAFRAWLPRQLQSRDFESVPLGRLTAVSVVVSSLAFGLLHGRWFAGSLAGVVYALALRRRGSVGDAVVAHATTNGLLCLWAVVLRDWSVM
jgi:exosortase E/protease (VPEID-CTERM system)